MRKAAGPSGVTGEMIKAAGEQVVDWLTSICNRIVKEESIPESWQMSKLVAIYKGKGDVLECSSSRGIKLLEHGMKVVERVLERRLWQVVDDDVVLRHTLPVFTGLGRCPIVNWDFAGAVSIFGPDALPVVHQ